MQEIPREQLRLLARKLLEGKITPGERKILERWIISNSGDEVNWEGEDIDEAQLGNRIFASIMSDAGVSRKGRRVYWMAAASIVVLFSAALYFWLAQPGPRPEQVVRTEAPSDEIMPGSDRAILTLGNGRRVMLEGQKLITDGDLNIRNENNELIYSGSSMVSFNTMSTPRGGQYQLRLPDGSKVWLNASSSITYPTVFTSNERVVELAGEAYFEVAKNPDMPFKVKVAGLSVNVLGTHFNVMAYDDEESVKTTLLEGAVQVARGDAGALLKPGQEATVRNTDEKIKIAAADVEQATAWKNGMFLFNKTDIKSIMRQLSRWYDFEVSYEMSFENRNFSGMISRKTPLVQVLNMLQMTKDVKFTIQGRTVTVI